MKDNQTFFLAGPSTLDTPKTVDSGGLIFLPLWHSALLFLYSEPPHRCFVVMRWPPAWGTLRLSAQQPGLIQDLQTHAFSFFKTSDVLPSRCRRGECSFPETDLVKVCPLDPLPGACVPPASVCPHRTAFPVKDQVERLYCPCAVKASQSPLPGVKYVKAWCGVVSSLHLAKGN